MNAYIVRIKKDREVVGLFAAVSLPELALMVDEYCCDPAVCEYRSISSGGIVWTAPKAPKVPFDGEDDTNPLAQASFGMAWGMELHGKDSAHAWRSLDGHYEKNFPLRR